MIKRCISLLCFTLFINSCENKSSQQEKADTVVATDSAITPESRKLTIENGCYGNNTKGNISQFTLVNKGNDITGNLEFAYVGKDENTGTFTGKVYGDKLIGDYTFSSEGVQSVREIAFKITDAGLVEGFGESMTGGNRMVFKDTSALVFDPTTMLVKGNCR